MYGLQNLSRNAPKILSATAQQCRNYNIVSKPRVRVSFPEKVLHGIFMTAVPLALPMYLATKFSDWSAANAE